MKGSPAFVATTFVVLAVSQLVQIFGWLSTIENRASWRADEYTKLASLRAGFSLEHFESHLGVPVFSNDADGGRQSSTYVGRDYWVHLVTQEGVVQSYAVTSCDADFRPMFTMPNGGVVVLNETTISALDDSQYEPYRVSYFAQQATAPTYMSEFSGSGNPSHYKEFAWGVNASCPMRTTDGSSLREQLFLDGPAFQGSIRDLEGGLSELRSVAIVNTYAETAPNAQFAALGVEDAVGVDPTLARTAITP